MGIQFQVGRAGRRVVAAALIAVCLPLLPPAIWAGENKVEMKVVLQSFVDRGDFAGAVGLVASEDKVLGIESVGYADLAARKPMRTDTVFWIASMSKPIAATALMMLVDEGKVKVDDPVEKYLPEFKDLWVEAEDDADHRVLRRPSHPVTIRNLLTHTSGLTPRSPLEVPHIDQLSLRENTLVYPVLALNFEPGSRYRYSNAGINTAGRIVEVVSGMPYERFLERRLFNELGMRDTTFWPNRAQVGRLAKSYRAAPGGAGLEETPIDQLTYPLTDRDRGACPAGGLFSTATDVSLFCRMIIGKGSYAGRRYLSPERVAEMTSVQTGELPLDGRDDVGYGFGWRVARRIPGGEAPASLNSFGHGGAYATDMWIDPPRRMITILMVQRAALPAGDGNRIRAELRKAAIDAYGR